jgi:hypothetical protein
MLIKPVPGKRVRDPDTKRVIPTEGLEVTESPYWVRRIQDGDVVRADGRLPSHEKDTKKK